MKGAGFFSKAEIQTTDLPTDSQTRILGWLGRWVSTSKPPPLVVVYYEKLSDDRLGEKSAVVKTRVEAARQIQLGRLAGSDLLCNADMRPAQIRQYCQLNETCNSLMHTAMSQMQLSARAYHRVLKLSRTIADLAGE